MRDHQTVPGDGLRLPGGAFPQPQGERRTQAAPEAHREQAEDGAHVRRRLGRQPPQRGIRGRGWITAQTES